MLVKVLHTGSCGGVTFTKDEVIDLPETVLVALGSDQYVQVEGQAVEVKQVRKSKNKMVKDSNQK